MVRTHISAWQEIIFTLGGRTCLAAMHAVRGHRKKKYMHNEHIKRAQSGVEKSRQVETDIN